MQCTSKNMRGIQRDGNRRVHIHAEDVNLEVPEQFWEVSRVGQREGLRNHDDDWGKIGEVDGLPWFVDDEELGIQPLDWIELILVVAVSPENVLEGRGDREERENDL